MGLLEIWPQSLCRMGSGLKRGNRGPLGNNRLAEWGREKRVVVSGFRVMPPGEWI